MSRYRIRIPIPPDVVDTPEEQQAYYEDCERYMESLNTYEEEW